MAAIEATWDITRSALAAPTEPVGRRWISYWTLAAAGMYLAYYGAQQIVIPRQTNEIAGNSAAAVNAQAMANLAAALVALVTGVVVGALSDRTRHRRGRRQVWVLGGALVLGASLALQGVVQSVLLIVVVWSIAQVGITALTAALTAAVPDEVPVGQRATVSAYLGVALSLGPLAGIALVTLLLLDVISAYLGLAAAAVLLALPFALRIRTVPLTAAERFPLSLRALAVGIVAPLRHTDFAWAWSGRFCIQLSNALGQLFLYQFLRDRVHSDPDSGTLILAAVYTVGVLLACIPSGLISDRSGRRKRLVVISSALQGVAGALLAVIPTMPAAIAGAAILGLGFGAYLAVDQALITQVLPHADDRGKDLGVINVANTLPYLLAAALGTVVINHLGGYRTLYLLVLVTGSVAALTVQPIKSVH